MPFSNPQQSGGGTSLPTQTGHAGEFLTTNGTDPSWGAIAAVFTPDAAILEHAGAQTPFGTIAEAQAAAVDGDTIHVYGSHTITTQLLIDGVNWHLHGASVSSSACHIFDDSATGANGAVTSRISGDGVFSTTGAYRVFYIFNAGTVLDVTMAEMHSADRNAFYMANGTIRIHCQLATTGEAIGGACIQTSGGTLEGWIGHIKHTGDSTDGHGLHLAESAGDLVVGTIEMTGANTKGITLDTSTSTIYATVRVGIVKHTGASGKYCIHVNGYGTVIANEVIGGTAYAPVYIESYGARLIVGRILNTASDVPAVLCNGGTGTYLLADYIENAAAGSNSAAVAVTNGTLHAKVLHAKVNTASGYALKVSGGTAHIHGGRWQNTNASGVALDVSGGTTQLYDSVVAIAGASATDGVYASGAKNLPVCGTLVTNKAINANVTPTVAPAANVIASSADVV